MLPQSYRFAFCELRTMENDLLTKGQIIKIGADFLEVSNDLGSASLSRYVGKVKVVINHKEEDTKVLEGNLYIPTMDFFRIIDMATLAEKEQRNFFRVNVNLPASMKVEPRGGGIPRPYDIEMVDLSLGGALLRGNMILSRRTRLSVEVFLDGKLMEHKATIVRCLRLSDGNYGYGIQFDAMDDTYANLICQYLFKRQKDIIEIK
ncbi:MAG: PilZ domain-containing protein [Erysipelotrichaceae bacterium]